MVALADVEKKTLCMVFSNYVPTGGIPKLLDTKGLILIGWRLWRMAPGLSEEAGGCRWGAKL